MAKSNLERYHKGEDHLQSEHWRLAELEDELAEADEALNEFIEKDSEEVRCSP
jgi:hypothetical protein